MSLFKKSEMKLYTAKDFDKQIPVGMIMIGANWCSFCQQLKPTWKQLYTDMNGTGYSIGAIDAMKHKDLIHMMGITGYPTILIVMNNGKFKEYTGPRTLEALKKKLPKLSMRLNKTKK